MAGATDINHDALRVERVDEGIPVTAVGASGAAVTLSIPAAPSGSFNFLEYLQIVLYAAAAQTGGATPITVTTTGLPNSPAFTFPTALAIGQVWEEKYEGMTPIRGSTNGAITVVCPLTAGVIWRVNAVYAVHNQV